MINSIILSGNLVQDHEFIYPYYRLLEENAKVDVCLLGGKPVEGILGTRIPPNKEQEVISIDDCSVENYNLLVIPGGAKAMEYLRQEKKILDFIYKFNEQNKIIASICHGAQLLISAKIVKDRKISGYYSVKDDIINAGGIYIDEPAVLDKNIITTAHYKHLGPWMKKTIEVVTS
jgi:protease I